MNAANMSEGDHELRARSKRLESLVPGASSVDEIDLLELFAVIWQGKWRVAAITTAFAVLSAAIALWIPNEYKATALLAPASSSSTSALTRLAGQFGGLAAIAGINLGGDGESDKAVQAIELVKTWDFLERFIRDNHLEIEVFAAKGWNRASNELIIDSELYDLTTKKWVRKFSSAKGETAEPSGWELYEELRDRISISQDKKTRLITLSVEHYSPTTAKEFVDKLVVAINTRLQEQDRSDASKSIDYLKKQVEKTTLNEMQVVFYRLIEEQTKNLMLTEATDEYALRTLSAAKIPEEKSQPKRAVICILGTLVGAILAIAALVISHWLRSASEQWRALTRAR
jgi:uncharacterized protein involved in exopolysaccharide biosynthesis